MLYDNPSGANTPFIPPLPSPDSVVQPPPVPTPDHREPPPSWAHQPQTPMNYPYYPSTPYNTTPFIPPMPSVHNTPASQSRPVQPGSYYPAPSALPVSPGMPPASFGGPSAPPGVSADFTGYPASLHGTPWAPPQPIPPPNAMPPLPWPGQHPATGYTSFNQPLPGPMWPPMPAPPMGPFTPAAAAWPLHPGMSPHPAAYAGYTPWQHPTQQLPIIKVPGNPGDTAQAAFRWTNNADRMDLFAEGAHCMCYSFPEAADFANAALVVAQMDPSWSHSWQRSSALLSNSTLFSRRHLTLRTTTSVGTCSSTLVTAIERPNPNVLG